MTDVPLPFPPADDDRAVGDRAVGDRAVAVALAGTTAEDGGTDARRPMAPPAALAGFVDAGVLSSADVHVAATLARLVGETDPDVLLAAALAVRAPRRKHVCVDLAEVRDTVVAELTGDPLLEVVDDAAIADLGWPDDVRAWNAAVQASPLVAVEDPTTLAVPDDAGRDVTPLRSAGTRLYLDRYWRYERRVAAALRIRAEQPVHGVDVHRARTDLDAAFGAPAPDRQRVAAAIAVSRRLAVIAGGPGTGKTTTVARILGTLDAQARAAGRPLPRVALAAPTGKAAARLTESLRQAADRDGVDDAVAERLREATATTLHRLLGSRGGTRFLHGLHDPLPHDVVVVDETSMVDLPMLAKLLEAVPESARLVLLGDPHQLASVEAGSVLGDVVGDPDAPPRRSPDVLASLRDLAGPDHLDDTTEADAVGVHDTLVVLDRIYRFAEDSGLDRFAAAVRSGDADAALQVLDTADDLDWVRVPATEDGRPSTPTDQQLAAVRERVVEVGAAVADAAAEGDGTQALAALERLRILCAHRRGEPGVAGWTARAEAWLRTRGHLDPSTRWYIGRPVLVTENDHRLQLWNGDLGVVVRAAGGGTTVAFPALDGHGVRTLAPARIGDVDTVHAMTVHKAQGSQVDHAVVVLPDPASRICTRELLYTAVTRAKEAATLVASEAALRATIAARTSRASGLGTALGR